MNRIDCNVLKFRSVGENQIGDWIYRAFNSETAKKLENICLDELAKTMVNNGFINGLFVQYEELSSDELVDLSRQYLHQYNQLKSGEETVSI